MSDWYDREGKPPWEIGRPQSIIKEWIDEKDFSGEVIDVGCGTGENALEIASQGYDVWGIDLSKIAIKQAKKKSTERGLDHKAKFRVENVMEIDRLERKFDVVVDLGLLHNFETKIKKKIVEKIYRSLNENGVYFILGFNEHEPLGVGPSNRIKKDEIPRLFENGWRIEYTRTANFESNMDSGNHNAWAVKAVKIT